MNFYEWLDRFVLFLRGYFTGLPLEERCRSTEDIILEALKRYKETHTGFVFREKEED